MILVLGAFEEGVDENYQQLRAYKKRQCLIALATAYYCWDVNTDGCLDQHEYLQLLEQCRVTASLSRDVALTILALNDVKHGRKHDFKTFETTFIMASVLAKAADLPLLRAKFKVAYCELQLLAEGKRAHKRKREHFEDQWGHSLEELARVQDMSNRSQSYAGAMNLSCLIRWRSVVLVVFIALQGLTISLWAVWEDGTGRDVLEQCFVLSALLHVLDMVFLIIVSGNPFAKCMILEPTVTSGRVNATVFALVGLAGVVGFYADIAQSHVEVWTFLCSFTLWRLFTVVPQFGIFEYMFARSLKEIIDFGPAIVMIVLEFVLIGHWAFKGRSGFYHETQNYDPFHDTTESLVSIMMSLTGEWADLFHPIIAGSGYTAMVYAVAYVFIVSILILNLIIGIVLATIAKVKTELATEFGQCGHLLEKYYNAPKKHRTSLIYAIGALMTSLESAEPPSNSTVLQRRHSVMLEAARADLGIQEAMRGQGITPQHLLLEVARGHDYKIAIKAVRRIQSQFRRHHARRKVRMMQLARRWLSSHGIMVDAAMEHVAEAHSQGVFSKTTGLMRSTLELSIATNVLWEQWGMRSVKHHWSETWIEFALLETKSLSSHPMGVSDFFIWFFDMFIFGEEVKMCLPLQLRASARHSAGFSTMGLCMKLKGNDCTADPNVTFRDMAAQQTNHVKLHQRVASTRGGGRLT